MNSPTANPNPGGSEDCRRIEGDQLLKRARLNQIDSDFGGLFADFAVGLANLGETVRGPKPLATETNSGTAGDRLCQPRFPETRRFRCTS